MGSCKQRRLWELGQGKAASDDEVSGQSEAVIQRESVPALLQEGSLCRRRMAPNPD